MHPRFTGDNSPDTMAPHSRRYEPPVRESIVEAAQVIYQRYCSIYTPTMPKPVGVAIDPVSHRGQLVFTDCPVLLPQERFIPIHLLEAAQAQPKESSR
ncbi:MAG: hypothetical protein AAFU78_06130 [Cyanobacteria bacterium J06633_2]